MAGRLPLVPKVYDDEAFANILRVIENRLNRLEASVRTYTVTNAGADVRSLDLATATLPDALAFLGTLVRDLQAAGKLGK